MRQCARVVELADSPDSGSGVRYGRAGSSPAPRTKLLTFLLFQCMFIKYVYVFAKPLLNVNK